MPYNADKLQFYQQYQNQIYVGDQRDHHATQYATGNIPAQDTPLEAVAAPHVYQQQSTNPGYPMSQPASSRAGHCAQPSIQEEPAQVRDQPPALFNRHVLAPRQPHIQVEVPIKPTREAETPQPEYQLLLLSLADEYLTTAHSRNMRDALAQGEAQLGDYYKLVSTALGCMETVLKRFRMSPVKEVHLRLSFARILYEETENDLEAETAISKGIDLCERNKLFDLKYTMQVLLSRVLYRSNPKAAIKAIDQIIEDVAAYQHTAWEYAFRFLRARLSLSMPSHPDLVAAAHHLQRVADLARQRGDQAVLAFAMVSEALAHLQSSNADSVEQAQRALAATRQVQLSHDVIRIPQIQVLVQYVDLCCSLQQSRLEQIGQKLSTMQQVMDRIVDDDSWADDGSIFLPVTPKSVQGIASMGGQVVQERDNRPVLTLNWLPRKDVYTIGYFLSAVATGHKNAQSDHQAELFLDEGLGLIASSTDASRDLPKSLAASSDQNTWRRILQTQFLLEKAFLLCGRSEWEKAQNVLNETDRLGGELRTGLPLELGYLFQYLQGAVYQGVGDVTKALGIYLSSDLALPPNCSKTAHGNMGRDIALLAAMNAILIIRSPTHPSHHLLSTLLSTIEPYLSTTPNQHIQASRSLLISNLPPSAHPLVTSESLSSTLLIKKHLSTALKMAKTIGNAQITAMTLSVMSAKFFRGVIGEQAEKSARAGQNMAYKSGMKLWMSVSNGMLAETLQRQGKGEEGTRAMQAAAKIGAQMPRRMQRFEGEGGAAATVGGVTKQEEEEERDELA